MTVGQFLLQSMTTRFTESRIMRPETWSPFIGITIPGKIYNAEDMGGRLIFNIT